MRQRGCHLTHRGQTRYMDQFRLQLLHSPLLRPAFGQVTNEAGEELIGADLGFADRQFHGKCRAVLAFAYYNPADADNPSLTGVPVTVEIAVVLLAVWRGHQ